MKGDDIFIIALVWLVGLVATIVFWGGLIAFTFWCAKHFGLIG